MSGFGLADGGMQPRQGQLVNVGEGGGDEMIVPLEPKWKDGLGSENPGHEDRGE